MTKLIKHNGISKDKDTLVFETPGTYHTHYIKVDTKKFGLPQTRNRTYMFVWQTQLADGTFEPDDLGVYWEQLVRFLESPVRHSLEAFLLEPDHDIIRVFREALLGPPGRQTKRGTFSSPDFWASASADLPHNTTARERLGLGDTARYITNWKAFGHKQVCPERSGPAIYIFNFAFKWTIG